MKNLGRIAVVLASLLAILIGMKYAREDLQNEIVPVKIERSSEASEFVRVDGNGNIVPSVNSSPVRKNDPVENAEPAHLIKVEGNEYVTFYVDQTTIMKAGDRVKMLTLVDFKTVIRSGGQAYRSSKTQHEYDCKENQWRLLNFSYYSGNMGAGEMIFSDTEPGKWEAIKPGSGTKKRWNIACGK